MSRENNRNQHTDCLSESFYTESCRKNGCTFLINCTCIANLHVCNNCIEHLRNHLDSRVCLECSNIAKQAVEYTDIISKLLYKQKEINNQMDKQMVIQMDKQMVIQMDKQMDNQIEIKKKKIKKKKNKKKIDKLMDKLKLPEDSFLKLQNYAILELNKKNKMNKGKT